METDTHGFNQCAGLGGKGAGRDDFLPWQHDEFLHGTVALYTQCLIVLASVHPSIAAGSAFVAIGVGVASDHHAHFQLCRYIAAHGFDDGTHFVPGNDRVECHGVASHEGVDVGATEADILQSEHHFACLQFGRFLYVNDVQFL